MCRKVLVLWAILACFVCRPAIAQQYAFQITFTDKNNTPFSLTSPSAYLSPRALARRATQDIAIDSTDLPVNAVYVDSVLTLTGGVLHGTSRWLNMCMVLLHDSTAILNLSGKSFISNVQVVAYYSSDLHHRPAHESGNATATRPVQKNTSADAGYYGFTWAQTQIVNGNYLKDLGLLGQGMLIAVLDAGFVNTNTHPGFDSMWQSGRVVDMFNFVYDTTNVFISSHHGTDVLSTIAGYTPGTFVGAAPLASYALYVSEYEPGDQVLEMDNMLCATERADSIGADVITESLGYDIFNFPVGYGLNFSTDLDGKTTICAKAANMATKKGMLFVATAGNDGYPVISGWGTHILTPGDADSALTIGSVDGTGTPAASSGYGPNAVGRIKPDVCGMGHSASIFSPTGYGDSADGTSLSTPQIAGWAACLWQVKPSATPYEIRQAIIKCASSYNSPGVQLGYGVANFICTEQILNVKDTPLPFTAANWVVATPNPFGSDLKIAANPADDGFVDFQLIDMQGRKVFSMHEYMYKGYNSPVYVTLPQLPAGIYTLRASAATRQQIIRLVKL